MGRDITQCHPRLQKIAAQLVEKCAEQGIVIKIGECFRTAAEQDALYAQGRTQPGSIITNAKGSSYSSYHQWGTAFDFYLAMDVDGDGKTSDDSFNNSTKLFNKVGAIGVGLGLEWGGNWKSIVDLPHFQLPDWGSSTSGIKKVYATPSEFMKTWVLEYDLGWNHDARGWWYADSKTTYLKSVWKVINHHKYYFNADGYAVTDWQLIDGKWYYFEPTAGAPLECALYVSDQDGVQAVGEF